MRAKALAAAAIIASWALAPATFAQPATATSPATADSFDRFSVGATYSQAAQHTHVEPIPSHSVAEPGQAFHVAVVVRIDPGYWLYGPAPGGKLVRPRALEVAGQSDTLTVAQALYPQATLHGQGQGEYYDEHYSYEGSATIYLPVSVPATAEPGQARIEVRMQGQLCDPMRCMELLLTPETTVTVGTSSRANAAFPPLPAWPATPRTAQQWRAAEGATPAATTAGTAMLAGRPAVTPTTWVVLLAALVAGVWLNVTPCVLPVIPLKIISLLEQAGGSRRRSVTLGLAYAAGILLFFIVIGVASAVLRLTTGHVLNLNEPFQYPAGIIAMALLLVVVALGLFDVFTISFSGRFAAAQGGRGHGGAVSTGVLTAILATPCTGPVILGVFGYAQTPPAWVSAAVFIALGLGMAAPHAVLAGFPRLLERLPRPGPWTEHLKRLLGFVLLGVAAWLISTLGSPRWIWRVSVYAVLLSGLVWIAGRWVSFRTEPIRRGIVRILAAVAAVAAGVWLLPAPPVPLVPWVDYNASTLADARRQGRVVMVRFTADWCLNCKVLDVRVYDTPPVAAAVRRLGVLAIRADVTRRDSPATALMAELGEPGPPATVIFAPGAPQPVHLSGTHGREELIEALERAAGAGAPGVAAPVDGDTYTVP